MPPLPIYTKSSSSKNDLDKIIPTLYSFRVQLHIYHLQTLSYARHKAADDLLGEDEMDEGAKWRDPKYKDKLYTQEPDDGEGDRHDYYYDTRPDNDPG
jgi:hypothetical protein